MNHNLDEPDVDRLLRAHRELESNPSHAISELKVLAELGSVSAMLHLGKAAERGSALPMNYELAEQWYRQAADRGLVSGYYFLGRLYLKMKRHEDALAVFRHSAAREYGPSLHYLGRMYYFGVGVEKDIAKSTGYLERAIKKKNILAKVLLAKILMASSPCSFKFWRGVFLRADGAKDFLFCFATEGLDGLRGGPLR